jgi:hypothetical protein
MANNDVLFSTNLKAALLGTSPLKTLIDNTVINGYSGAFPTDPDAALSGATLLFQICKGDAALAYDLAWDATTTPGLLQKPSADTWSTPTGTGAIAAGTASFFVINVSGDNNSTTASGTNYRIIGKIGGDPTYALFLTNLAITVSTPVALNQFYIYQP